MVLSSHYHTLFYRNTRLTTLDEKFIRILITHQIYSLISFLPLEEFVRNALFPPRGFRGSFSTCYY